MKDVIAGVERHAIGRPVPEVEITRRFDDPGHRLNAMNDFAEMVQWMEVGAIKLTMCETEGGKIIWRFQPASTKDAVQFNAAFDIARSPSSPSPGTPPT
jgi:hypothetical protein